MNTQPENLSLLEKKILEAETRLEELEQEVEEIGQPAGHELRHRLDVLKIEAKALLRNFEESKRRGEPDSVRLNKIEALLRHIEDEESSVGHDADFLHQAAPSSVTVAMETGAHVVDLLSSGFKRVIGGHHPLGESVFVNHSHESLETEFGLVDREKSPDAERF
jgi:chromosome segregation ATPase